MSNDLEGTEFGGTFISMQKLMEENADLKLENEKLRKVQMGIASVGAEKIVDLKIENTFHQSELSSLRAQLEEEKANLAEYVRLKGRLNEILHPNGDGPSNPSFCDLISYVREDLKIQRSEISDLKSSLYSVKSKIQQLQEALSCAVGALEDSSITMTMGINHWHHLNIEIHKSCEASQRKCLEALTKIQSLRDGK